MCLYLSIADKASLHEIVKKNFKKEKIRNCS